MGLITIQMGHVTRRSGATGTHREQEAASAIGHRLARALRDRGHSVSLIGADDAVPRSDYFVALHTDGNASRDKRGCSVGYPDEAGGHAARIWKEEHQKSYKGGALKDNYTTNLSGYYGFRKAKGAKYRFLAEHCFTTNPTDCSWLFSNLDAVVDAHLRTVGRVLGHPGAAAAPAAAPIKLTYTEVNVAALPVLKRGASGHHVRVFQSLLNLTGVTDPLATDGGFGERTEGELKEWQNAHVARWKPAEFDAHGEVGQHTWHALLGVEG